MLMLIMIMEILKKQQVTRSIIGNISPYVLVDIKSDYFLGCYDDKDDEYFVDQDFVYFTLRNGDKIYYMIHGFPGDNTSGIVFDEDGIIAWLDEDIDPKNPMNDFEAWYTELHKESENHRVLYM